MAMLFDLQGCELGALRGVCFPAGLHACDFAPELSQFFAFGRVLGGFASDADVGVEDVDVLVDALQSFVDGFVVGCDGFGGSGFFRAVFAVSFRRCLWRGQCCLG